MTIKNIVKHECKHCEYFNLNSNKCLLDDTQGYESNICLNIGCTYYKEGNWQASIEKELNQ